VEDKIAVIGHSYHLKTRSSSFFTDLLRKYYNVEFMADSSWQGKKGLKISHLDGSYKAVIFFQMISQEYLKEIECQNVIFVPMYDQSGDAPMSFWYRLRNVKVISFCKALGTHLHMLGFDVLDVTYYPKPMGDLKLATSNTCFFWQRTNVISWQKVKVLLSNLRMKSVHIHTAIDPGYTFTKPSLRDEKRYNIHYSKWFRNQCDYLQAVDENQIYIAPRLKEGIGMSFLEAMARGKVVVAADRPTMNEYIKNGYNGYLFDPDKIEPIDFSDIEKVGANAILTIEEGYQKWVSQERSIIDFIEKPVRKNFYFRRHPFARFDELTIKSVFKGVIKAILPFGIVKFVRYLRDNGRWKRIIKEAVKLVIPYGVMQIIWKAKKR